MKHLYLKVHPGGPYSGCENGNGWPRKAFCSFLMVICLLAFAGNAMAQSKTVSGKISDETGNALPGANVIVKGTTQGTTTDADGNYNINLNADENTLVFSFIGFATQEVVVGDRATINISLVADMQSLDEVVVVGYGVQRKSDLTGSVTTIDARGLTGIRGGNAAEALQGKSGLTVVSSGQPGASPTIRIRGIGTNGDARPLYVVDGMMLDDISWLNTNDIETMTILKDASATAIYGSRGANGVIMINTKKGKSGKPVLSYSASEGYQFAINNYDVADGTGYAKLMNIVATTNGEAAPYANPSQFGKGTDWMDEITRKGWMRDHQLSLSGGSETTRYFLSLGYFEQEGIWNSTNYDRWTLRANNEYKVNSKIKVGHDIAASFARSGQGLSYRTVRSVLSSSPLITPKNDVGGWNPMQNGDLINPVAELELNKETHNRNIQLLGNFWGSYEIIKGLTLRTSLAENWGGSHYDKFAPKYAINPSHQTNSTNSYNESFGTSNNWLWTNTLTFDKELTDKHYLNLLLGYTAEKSTYSSLGATATNFVVDDLDYVSIGTAGAANRTVNPGTKGITSRMSYMFRANYTLMDRYLLTATLRADGSSKFGTNNQWGYFPSAAVGWRIKEESFLKDVNWLSNLKLRASWGVTGNDKITDNVSYALVTQSDEFHAVFNGTVYSAAGIVNAYNTNVKWESNQQKDIGLEMGLLDDRFTVEFDYFDRKTKDLLMILPAQGGSVGIAPTYTNTGTVRNKGFDFTAAWQENRGALTYGIKLVGSTFKNEVTYWGEQIHTNNVWSTNLYTRINEGEPFNYFYGYKTQGIYRTQADLDKWNAYAVSKGQTAYHSAAKVGDLIYVDVNNDGIINGDDQTNIGSPFPKFTGSLALSAEYKGFDLSIDFAGSFGAKVMNNSYNDFTSTTNNMHTDWLNAWTPERTDTNMPRLAGGSVNMNRTIDLMVFNGDYVKLRSLVIGYTLPEQLVTKAGIGKARFYFTATNLLYFTRYKGFTPELMDGLDSNTFPISGSAQLGVNLTF